MQIKKLLSFNSYLPVYSLVVLIFNIFLLNFPLVNVFGYEFSAVNSVLLVLVSGLFVISFIKRRKEELKHLFQSLLVLLLIPFLVSVFNSLFTGFCSFTDGFLFYLVLTIPAVVIGCSLGLSAFFNVKRFPRLFFILLFVIVLLIPLTEFYLNPQVYFYNPVLGYLPGTIYDEGLSVDLKLTGYRLLNILFFGLIFIYLLFGFMNKLKVNKILLNSFAVIVPAVFIYLSPSLSYSTTYDSLESELNKNISTENFEIYFSPDIDDNFVKLIILHHEFYYSELKEFLKTEPSEKIRSYIFSSRRQKKELFGTASADVAKPWLYSIFITYDNYNSSLKHEIAHCFSAEFGTGLFKVADKINPYLIEGIAVASSPFYDENSIDYMAAVAYKNGYKINFDNMFEFSGFFTQLSSLSYIYAGSFTKYLIGNYGIEKYKMLYADLDFESAYSESFKSLVENWKNYIETIDAGETVHKANYYFGRRSIFYKVCPRYISDRLERAWGFYSDKKYDEAEKIFYSVLEKDTNYSAVTGLTACLYETRGIEEAVVFLEKHLNSFRNTSGFYNLSLRLADLYAEKQNYDSARVFYARLNEQNPHPVLFYITELRKALLESDNLIYSYLSGSDSDKYKLLKELSRQKYYFEFFPVMINLSKNSGEQYDIFVKQFDKTIHVTDFISSYAVYSLSKYMLENLDFLRARKMAALALRYTGNKNFSLVLNENFRRMNWIYQNADSILSEDL